MVQGTGRRESGVYLTAMIAMAAGPSDAPPAVPPGFTLQPPPRSERIVPPPCQRGRPDEIVVCGRDAGRDRLTELKPPPGIVDRKGGVVGLDVGDARIEPKLEEVEFPGGMVSKRVMVTVKIPF